MSQKIFALSLLTFIFSPQSFAGLGDSKTTTDQEQASIKAKTVGKSSHQKFFINTLKGDGTTIHEYVSQRGVVFAVTWEGPAHPDLDALLSKYSSQYRALAKNQPKIKGMRSRYAVQSGNLVVERAGHFGRLIGRAYDPTLLPEGVSIEEIQ